MPTLLNPRLSRSITEFRNAERLDGDGGDCLTGDVRLGEDGAEGLLDALGGVPRGRDLGGEDAARGLGVLGEGSSTTASVLVPFVDASVSHSEIASTAGGGSREWGLGTIRHVDAPIRTILDVPAMVDISMKRM